MAEAEDGKQKKAEEENRRNDSQEEKLDEAVDK